MRQTSSFTSVPGFLAILNINMKFNKLKTFTQDEKFPSLTHRDVFAPLGIHRCTEKFLTAYSVPDLEVTTTRFTQKGKETSSSLGQRKI